MRVVQLNCSELQENAMKEAKIIRDNLIILISQLSSRVQTMKVWFGEMCDLGF